ncbi:glycosyltransferase [Epibacterium sp. SM1969]|uniref:Glycosyltransferase n=1 Tax=Tritonibacter aquimaris TaxID=2663379 RepID=A0A844B255_9RHOB|nr:glycosyltransferase [Tritonibacter aquimaris]MQY44171.1 glycosyltransferase [Tritonibacter aquimaris]
MMSPRYSLVIPAYNDASGLARTLRYFETCSAAVEILLVDDGSEDNTAEVVEQARLPASVTLEYHRQPHNQGPAAARNLGIENARADRLLFLDADDILTPNIFALLDQVDLRQDFILFKHHLATRKDQIHSYNMHLADRQFFSNLARGGYPAESLRLKDCPEAAGTVNFPWNKLYRRDFLLEQEIRFPDYRMHEDILFHWQCFLRCGDFAVLNWAPPLLTHFELPAAGRATHYVGEKRLAVVDLLAQVEDELLRHPDALSLEPVFAEFCEEIFTWMITTLKQDEAGNSWTQRYQDAAERFWSNSKIAPPEQPQDETGDEAW